MKGYWIILGTNISDQNAQSVYSELWAPIAEKYHARVILNNKSLELKEARNTQRCFMVEFPSYELAKTCYNDPEYQRARKYALAASERDLLIIEGDMNT